MELIDLLKKYRYQIPINKTKLYKELQTYKQQLQEEGFSFTIKTMEDLFDLEVICKGIVTKNQIDQCYNRFVSENYDAFEYINYDEKRKMFNHDLSTLLSTFPMFQDHLTHIDIYVPFFETFINQRYIEDYQVLELKQHEKYLKNYPRVYTTCRTLYGIQPYLSDFSSLIYVAKENANIYLYSKDSKSIFIYNDQGQQVEELCIIDKYSVVNPSDEDIRECISKLIEQGDTSVVNYMLEKGFIKEKTYTKINKKLG